MKRVCEVVGTNLGTVTGLGIVAFTGTDLSV